MLSDNFGIVRKSRPDRHLTKVSEKRPTMETAVQNCFAQDIIQIMVFMGLNHVPRLSGAHNLSALLPYHLFTLECDPTGWHSEIFAQGSQPTALT